MARIETDPNYSSPTFSRATAATDLFKKEDVQALAAAMSTHVHDGAGKGLVVTGLGANAVGTTAIADGAVTSAKIADGTIATVDLANASVTNAKLASDTARANLLTNGGFEIWQRGNGPFAQPGTDKLADRWQSFASGTDTFSISRDGSNNDPPSIACAAVVFTLGSGAGTSQIYQVLKAVDLYQQYGAVQSFSARVKTATPNAVRIGIATTGAGGATAYSTFHPGDGQYHTLTVTLSQPGSGASQVTTGFYFAASCTAYLDNAMLVVGGVPADYAPMHPADDLAHCERYYEVPGADGVGSLIVWGLATGSNTARGAYRFRSKKAVTPTATKVGTWTLQNATLQPTVSVTGVDGFYLFLTSTGAGDFYAVNDAATKYLTFEANP